MKHLIPAISLLLAACSASSDEATSEQPSALVVTAPVSQGGTADVMTLYGRTDADAAGRLAVPAPIDAIVTRIVSPVGTTVPRGTILAVLTPGPTARLDLARAQAEARSSAAALARAVRLRSEGTIGDGDVETARASAAMASATRQSLAARMSGLTLRAPAPGVIETVPVKPGDMVTAGATIATLLDAHRLVGRFGIEPVLARDLVLGSPVTIGSASDNARYPTRIISVAPLVDPQSQMASILVAMPAGRRFAAGEPLVAALHRSQGGGGTGYSVPYAALLDDAGQPFVYVVSRGVAHRRNVLPGAVAGDRVAIDEGLRGDERVVVRGVTALADGMKVRTR